MRAFVFGFVGRLTPRDDGHGGTSSESRDVDIFASHAADPTLVTALNLVACEVIVGHDHDDAGHYQTSFGDSAKRCYTLVVVPRGGKDRSDTNTTTLACEDGGPPDHALVSALASRKRSAGLVRVVFGILVASRGSPVSTTPEPDACAAWLDTLRAEFESRYSSGAYVGRTKTIGRGDSYNFEALAETLRRLTASSGDNAAAHKDEAAGEIEAEAVDDAAAADPRLEVTLRNSRQKTVIRVAEICWHKRCDRRPPLSRSERRQLRRRQRPRSKTGRLLLTPQLKTEH